MMKVLYIGETKTHEQYQKGNVPSHWFYGAIEMEHGGHKVIWAQEGVGLFDDMKIIRTHEHDIVFIPNLNLHNHLMLLLMSAIGLYRRPIYAYLHHEPSAKKGVKSKLYKLLLGALSHIFFLSELTLEETVKAGLVSRDRCSVPGWGPDMAFYGKVDLDDNGWFVSTGKENRDFETLIEAFRITGAPLHIITAKSHNGVYYDDLKRKCENIHNIKVTILENTPANYPLMIHEMGAARALVCPLLKDKLTYCVGLSTIVDSEGLRKPLIITENPYHGPRTFDDNMCVVNSVSDWVDAISAIQSSRVETMQSSYSMETAYNRMKEVIKM